MLSHIDELHRLAPAEQQAWLGFLRTYAEVVGELDAELEHRHGLSLSAYDVLVKLSLASGRELRMSELAAATLLSRAGTTRLVERLERDDLVERRNGERDNRQVFARITDRGLERLGECAATHIAGVRERFIAPLTTSDKRALAGAWERILAHGAARGGARAHRPR